jgi:3-oxoacyl-[acyl-carrier-protein] synthase I
MFSIDMTEVFVAADNIFTPLGFTTTENIACLKKNLTAIKTYQNEEFSPIPFCASLIDPDKLDLRFNQLKPSKEYTRLEKMFILSIRDALKDSKINIKDNKTLIIISTTKGNIDLLEEGNRKKFDSGRTRLGYMAKIIQDFFQNPNAPIVISNACISGVLAIITASRLLRSGQYENIVISGGDIISAFTVSGFQSFKALSLQPCKPFDASRDGLNLGEAAGTIVLTSNPDIIKGNDKIVISGGATRNDANHISGPSRTGDGLFIAIKNALAEAKINSAKEIEYISAHGTATPYNDEMESKAFALAHLDHVPVNSLKGFFGHTLGAAGVIESIAGIRSLQENVLFNTLGYHNPGVTQNINIIKKFEHLNIKNCLKTASGFGGCNAAVLFSKK